MSKQRIATISLAAALATASAGVAAAPAAAAPQSFPASPGACNMFHVFGSAVGFAGGLKPPPHHPGESATR
jgi:hypothetical protein